MEDSKEQELSQEQEQEARNAEVLKNVHEFLSNSDEFNIREKLFIGYYLLTLRGPESARLAGYSSICAVRTAFRLLHTPKIKQVIDSHVKNLLMSAEEMKARTSMLARSSMSDMLKVKDGQLIPDWDKARDLGAIDFIKKFKVQKFTSEDKNGKTESEETFAVEIMEPLPALTQIGKMHGLVRDKLEIVNNSGDDPLELLAKMRKAKQQKLLAEKKKKSYRKTHSKKSK